MENDALRRVGRRGALGLAAGMALAGGTRAQGGWPDRATRLIVPFGAGGAIDTLSRTVANAFPGVTNGQTLVVENRPGAGGAIAGAFVAQQRPDGQTLMMADLSANAIGRELNPGLPYDPMTSFTAICHLVNLPLVLIVPAALPVQDVASFFAYARARGDLPYAHPGIGYIGHLAQELMIRRAGLRMTAVPYRSGAEMLRSIVAGEGQSGILTVSTSLPLIREGRVKALAVLSPSRIPALPEVPPLAETLPGFVASVWHGIVAPAGMAPELATQINRVFNQIAQNADVRRSVEGVQQGQVVGGSPAEFAAFIRAEYDRWAPVIREAGIRAQ
jgi:tripartite-type tricarboxylate transporter receptor subunit TctC